MRTKELLIASAGALLLLGSCDVEDPIYHTTHPNQGKITLTTDWSHIGEGLAIPASYTVKAADFSTSMSGITGMLDYQFEPGNYDLNVYNTPEHVTVNGTIATVASAAAPATETGAFIHNTPGWFFSSSTEVSIEKDKVHQLTAAMQQQIRQLTLIVELTGDVADRVDAFIGTLSGVAGAFDFQNGVYTTPSNVALTFSEITDGEHAGKWKATVRLLGVLGSVQMLKGKISFTNQAPEVDFDSNLSSSLALFNNDKRNPLTLVGTVVETPTEAGFTSTIKEWEIVERDPVTAE